jgi:phage terminase large subunit-like protein
MNIKDLFNKNKIELRNGQKEPYSFFKFWVIKTGRGWGKQFTGINWILSNIKKSSNKNFLIFVPTNSDRRILLESKTLKKLKSYYGFTFNSNLLLYGITLPNNNKLFIDYNIDNLRGKSLNKVWIKDFDRIVNQVYLLNELNLCVGNNENRQYLLTINHILNKERENTTNKIINGLKEKYSTFYLEST